MERSQYQIYSIKKPPKLQTWISKSGVKKSRTITRDPRIIQAPKEELKIEQRQMLDTILNRLKLTDAAHGFVQGRNVKSNAMAHQGASCLLTMDLKNFFPSVKENQVRKELIHRGFSQKEAESITNLCTLEGCLPQGAPTSPALANLVAREMDHRLTKLCLSENIVYTRYADDLTFSGERDSLDRARPKIQSLINRSGWNINGSKTRTVGSYREMDITGVTINHGLDVSLKEQRKMRDVVTKIKLLQIRTPAQFEMEIGNLDVYLGYAGYMTYINKKYKPLFQTLHNIRKEKG